MFTPWSVKEVCNKYLSVPSSDKIEVKFSFITMVSSLQISSAFNL